jgi:hypothetical protein
MARTLSKETHLIHRYPSHPFLNMGRAVAGAGVLLASGCSQEDVDSDAIRTQGMFADMLALAPGDGSTLVRVDLTVGGESGTNVNLVADDRLEARVGELTEPLAHAGEGRYEQRIEGDSASAVSVSLLRGPDDVGAGGSVMLPEPFSTTLETDAAAGIARDAEVVVSWAPPVAGGTLHWSVEGRCVWSESGDAADDGLLTLGPENIRVRGTQNGEECEVIVTLDRENAGGVDAAWIPGSRIRAIQRRGVGFVSTPARSESGGSSPDAG